MSPFQRPSFLVPRRVSHANSASLPDYLGDHDSSHSFLHRSTCGEQELFPKQVSLCNTTQLLWRILWGREFMGIIYFLNGIAYFRIKELYFEHYSPLRNRNTNNREQLSIPGPLCTCEQKKKLDQNVPRWGRSVVGNRRLWNFEKN